MKYPKPNILLIDLEPTVSQKLKDAGFNVEEGSFGKRYIDAVRTRYPVMLNGKLPYTYGEKEIVVVDMSQREPLPEPEGTILRTGYGDPYIVQNPFGVIDPRPFYMGLYRNEFDRIYSHGGIFIVFAGVKELENRIEEGYSENLYPVLNTWSFLTILGADTVVTSKDVGEEINIASNTGTLGELVRRYLHGSRYECVISEVRMLNERCVPLAKNKFGNDVSGFICPNTGWKGWILIFPNIGNKSEFLVELIAEYLPGLKPDLFPYAEKAKWKELPEYQLPQILDLERQINQIQNETTERINDIKAQIYEEQTANRYLYDLITETGDNLVRAVAKALDVVGFQNVVDMDEESKNEGSQDNKREDLQIQDRSPLVLVEVKGIAGKPKQHMALQVSKYIMPRARILNRLDIRGLAIINHQKHLPGLDREKNPFDGDILTNAKEQEFGLLTGWNLYRLVRSYLKLGWKHEQIVDLFYQNGFIEPTPSHYEEVGVVEHFWPQANAVGIRVKLSQLRRADRIAFEFEVEFEEQSIDSLQIEKQDVEIALAGSLAGVLTVFTKDQLKKGTRVFRVGTEEKP